jgi:diacylglycerol kinase family enzyme
LRWLAVVNRAAGRFREAERWLAELERLPAVAAMAAYTDGPGSATLLARDARDCDGLIVIGGDGTVSECLAGMDLPRQRLAVIPSGHGNCLARDLGLRRPADALSALQRPDWRTIDLMELTVESASMGALRRLCASTIAVGYVTDVVETGRQRLAALGRSAYAAAAFVTRPRQFTARCHVDGEVGDRWQSFTGIVVNNTVHLANFRAFTGARLDDGRLDLMLQGYGWARQLLHNGAVLAGSAAFGPLGLRKAAQVSLRFDTPRTLMADGELLPETVHASVVCRPSALTCVAVSR